MSAVLNVAAGRRTPMAGESVDSFVVSSGSRGSIRGEARVIWRLYVVGDVEMTVVLWIGGYWIRKIPDLLDLLQEPRLHLGCCPGH